ncbi:MAG: putative lipid II flippase FtsW [Sinimarinibacterium flocculans]|uniref:Probable peptidoglycan glycosyltransferase FtsW n=1 Tax=Sinimarinibacterium flocculans TaxID=985250 RepID=A0A318EAC8_9GAMM|nr:putative lipid II flippase FtsW [Sinimarinibacterium flocculans]MEC9363290.1 putative lipid II flippase FtsW [Pseudomonadota bacterium]PXV69527.1 cell division-specific peptidoglycan biosynthesis regulator FtsW [Sinimarinibacterium flocculans]
MNAALEGLQSRLPLPRARYGLDAWLCGAIAVLLLWGLIMVASASVAQAEKMTGDAFYFFYRQVMFAVLGIGIGAAMYCVPLAAWARLHLLLYLLAVLLLAAVLLPGIGVEVNSARRWIDVGVFRLQASEPARLALIVFIANYIARRQAPLQHTLKGLLLPLGAMLLPCLLLLLEPDFGATAILMGVVFVMLFLGGARVGYYAGMLAVAVAGLAYIAVAAPYRLKRLLNFTNPWADVENGGWQLAQSLIAVGRGEWTGVGLGNSVQKLLYLPEMHTDFIFAILAEELGLLGILALLLLFGVVVARGLAIGRAAELAGRQFPAFLAYGLTGWIGLQALINMAVNLGLLPTKGLTLPLLSYGGSSLLTVCAMVGLLLRVDYENRSESFGAASAQDQDSAARPRRRYRAAEARS